MIRTVCAKAIAPPSLGRADLEQFDGVGTKTSGAVVNFSTLRRRAMCVDSHHLRVTQRLGLVRKNADARETEDRLMEMAPPEWSRLCSMSITR